MRSPDDSPWRPAASGKSRLRAKSIEKPALIGQLLSDLAALEHDLVLADMSPSDAQGSDRPIDIHPVPH